MCIKCVEAVTETFPEVPDAEVGNFLMSCTAFPCGDAETVLRQLRELRAKTSNYKACYGIVEDEMEKAMKRYKEEPDSSLAPDTEPR
jgi:hypothetical protein